MSQSLLAGPSIDLSVNPKSVSLDFTNIGRNPVRRGIATLFGVDKDKDWTRKQKLGEAAMIGAGTNIVPGYNGRAKITFDDRLHNFFLACVSYYDESNSLYHQAFLLSLGTVKGSEGSLDELEQPSANACS